MKRLVLFVEGPGDHQAAPVLVKRIRAELAPELSSAMFVDDDPFTVKGVQNLTGKKANEWIRYLGAAAKRKSFGGVLLLLDAEDHNRGGKRTMCLVEVARELADRARTAGAGKMFSVGVVFLLREFESLFIAGYNSLPKRKSGVQLPENVEEAPRNAKGWLKKHLEDGYGEIPNQKELAEIVDIGLIRQQNLKSFGRLKRAVAELARAFMTGEHVSTPLPPEEKNASPNK